MNRFIVKFERDAREVCDRNGVPDYYSSIRLYKNTSVPEASIQSIGQFIKGSRQERAANEIIAYSIATK